MPDISELIPPGYRPDPTDMEIVKEYADDADAVEPLGIVEIEVPTGEKVEALMAAIWMDGYLFIAKIKIYPEEES